MLTRIAGGRIIDPANRRDGVGDLWMLRRQHRGPARRARAPMRPTTRRARSSWPAPSTSTPISPAGNVNTARCCCPSTARPQRRPAGRLCPGRPDDASRPDPLCRHGLHHRGRAGDLSAPALHAHLGACRHSDHRQGDPRDARQRRLSAAACCATKESTAARPDYAALELPACRARSASRSINAGGAAAFKDNVRAFSFDDDGAVLWRLIAHNRQSPAARRRMRSAFRIRFICIAATSACAGNVETALATIAAAEGAAAASRASAVLCLRQGGRARFLLGRAPLAEAVNANERNRSTSAR